MSALSKAEIESFFSNEKNREAVKEMQAKTKEILAILEAAKTRIGEVRDAVVDFNCAVTDAVNYDSVDRLKEQLQNFKEILEYTKNFMDNKIVSFPSKTEPKFDVAKMFGTEE